MIKYQEINKLYYIGANGSGKTHTLKRIQAENEVSSFFIDEYGKYQSLSVKRRVQINNGYYYYLDDTQRGRGNETKIEPERQVINSNLTDILNKVYEIKQKLDTFGSSPGIDKLKTITNELLTRNLNNIEIFIIDEPESFLDDYNLKIFIDILNQFYQIGIKLRFATHSSRFLELNKAQIDEIVVLKPKTSVRLTYVEIKNCFTDISENILNYPKVMNLPRTDAGIVAKLSLKDKGLDIFLESVLSSAEFYRCLFYDEVNLAEGMTEKLLIMSLPADRINNKNFFFTNGKAYIPFYLALFLKYELKVRAIFDSDQVEGNENTTVASGLTEFIKDCYKEESMVSLIISNGKDIEAEYSINQQAINEFQTQSNISRSQANSNYFKPYIALFSLRERNLLERFADKLVSQENLDNYSFD